jgi:energy-coupling factor transporter ATP-binding protein EcfA2
MIRRIAIKGFRSLDVDFGLQPVSVLVGRSGTGKTNLVNGLQWLRQFLLDPRPVLGENSSPWFWQKARPQTEAGPATIRLRAEFDVPPLPNSFCYEIAFSYAIREGSFAVAEEKLTVDGRVLFHVRERHWRVAPTVTGAPQPHPHTPVLAVLNGVQLVSVAHLALVDGLGCYDFPGSVCTGNGREGTADSGLADNAANYAQVFEVMRKDLSRLSAWDDINAALRALNSSFSTVDTTARQGGRMLVAHDFGGKVVTFDIAQESEGFRRFLAHLLALYQTPSKQTLVFEEPEKGIHPGALQTLAEEIKACPEAGRGQVILTTHSPDLLNHFSPESIRVVEIHGHVTRIGPIAPDQVASLKEDLLRPGELLTVEDARIGTESAAS